MCKTCSAFGIWACRETVGTCDLCGRMKDVFMLMDYADENDFEGKPAETVCLDCLSAGKHMKAAHEPKNVANNPFLTKETTP